jgi:transcriptional regulator with PAS, ATPase and Fis domain
MEKGYKTGGIEMAENIRWDDFANEKQWRKLHGEGKGRHALKGAIRKAWERSVAGGISPESARPRRLTDSEFQAVKAGSRRLFVFASSILADLMRHNRAEDFGLMLFDPQGCVLSVIGSDGFRKWADQHDIRKGDCWEESAIGASIFSVGIARAEGTAMRGEESFARFLIGGSYHFSTIKLDRSSCLGGLLLVTRADKHSEFLTNLAVTAARAVELQFFWFGFWNANYDISEGTGALSLDQSKNSNRILTMSQGAFKLLGIPVRDVYYQTIESLIDTGPANQAFWDIVNQSRTVVDEAITLTVGGRATVLNLSATAFQESRFNIKGIMLSFSSIKRINKLVSQYGGNAARYSFGDIVGGSDASFSSVFDRAKIASRSPSNVMLLGESGVGKDVFAQAIHNSSKRKNGAYVALNCAAFSKELIASELFGYESGSFTGAKKGGNIGKFQLASGGTLFLDEIGDMPLDVQAVLLRVLDERSFFKVGGNTMIPVDVRVIAATNKNLWSLVQQRLFREDLYYRLGVIRIRIPPLRARGNDIFLLSEYFAGAICEMLGKPVVSFSDDARMFMTGYHWPGNIRELRNLLEGILETHDTTQINAKMMRDYLGDMMEHPSAPSPSAAALPETESYSEKQIIEQALRRFRGNRSKAASSLNMSRSTFYRRLEEYGL